MSARSNGPSRELYAAIVAAEDACRRALEQSEPMAAAVGVDAFGHVWDVPARREYDVERSRQREQAWASGRSGVRFG